MASEAGTAVVLGYARVSAGPSSLDAQIDALIDSGVDPNRVYTDNAQRGSAAMSRPGMRALLDYARAGDTVAVVGIDRLGRTAPEVMATIRELDDRDIRLRSLRERIDTGEVTGHMIVGVLASLAILDDERGPANRHLGGTNRPPGGLTIGRPRALSAEQVTAAELMRARGEPVAVIAESLGVSRATLYRSLAGKGAAQ